MRDESQFKHLVPVNQGGFVGALAVLALAAVVSSCVQCPRWAARSSFWAGYVVGSDTCCWCEDLPVCLPIVGSQSLALGVRELDLLWLLLLEGQFCPLLP